VDTFDGDFARCWSRAYAVAYVVLGDRTESEDVAQETMARALVRWRRVADHAEPWVVRVAGNLAIDHARKRSRRRALPGTDVPGPDGRYIDLQRALLGLSARQRDVVVMRYLADLPEVDVAATLKCSVGTVRTHAARGLAALRRMLEDSHD
jgi:DNA-directed RNA polymerase specialized sigma24 family protein